MMFIYLLIAKGGKAYNDYWNTAMQWVVRSIFFKINVSSYDPTGLINRRIKSPEMGRRINQII